MSNLDELIKIFEEALKNKSNIVLDPYDYCLVLRTLDYKDAINLYNLLAAPINEAIEDGVMEDYEIILTFNKRIFKKIISLLKQFNK